MSNLRIDIASEFTGGKAFRDAEKATNSLDAAVAKLSKKMTQAFSAYKIAQFGKNAAKAFMEDEKAAASLANQLKNLGFASVISGAEDFIQTMQKQTGVLDDQLRPAYAQLARVTGSVAKTQDLMKLAFDVSSGSGSDYQTVIDALSQAYVGNTKSLKQLNLGLTNAELSTKSFAEIQALLAKQFGGAGAASLNTYAGQLSLLNAHVADASELIGKSLLDALTLISGDQGFGGFISKVDTAAQKVSDLITFMSRGVRTIEIFLNPKATMSEKLAEFKKLQNQIILEDSVKRQQSMFTQWQPKGAWTPEQKKLEAQATARAKALADAIKKQNVAQEALNKKKQESAKLDALSLKYKQAESIFNLDQIEIAAAMQNKQTNEDLARLQLKKDLAKLQDAINAGNVEEATKLASLVDIDLKRVNAYQAMNAALVAQQTTADKIKSAIDAMTPKPLFDLKNIDAALDKVATLITRLGEAKAIWSSAMSTAADEFPKKVGGTSTAAAAAAATTAATDAAAKAVTSISEQTKSQTDQQTETATAVAAVTDSVATVADTVAKVADTVAENIPSNEAIMGGINLPANGSLFPTTTSSTNLADYADLGFINMLPQTNSLPVINVTVTDNATKLVDIVTDITQNATANGIPLGINRSATTLAW